VKEIIESIDSELDGARTNYYNAQSRLELLGLSEACGHLSSYRDGEAELRAFRLDLEKNVTPSKDFFNNWSAKYVPIQNKFRKSLSDSFLESA
jgi:hypothetical protein